MSFLKYFVNYALGMLSAIVTDTIVTSLALGSIALGVATSVALGVAMFFLLYVVIRTVNTVANAIGTGSMLIARSTRGSDV